MQHAVSRFFPLVLLTIAAVACGDDDPVQPQPQVAQLRIVNAADIPNVQVRRVGTTTPLAQDLNFRGSTQTCVQVPTGEQALVFTSTGVELATTAFTFEPGMRYTAFLVASGPTRRALVLSDNETATSGNNALRLINATSAPGDVYATAPGAAVGAAFRVAGNMSVLATSNDRPSFAHRSTEHTQVRLDPGTTTGTPRADFTLANLPASRLATVVFTEPGTPAGATAFMVTPCP